MLAYPKAEYANNADSFDEYYDSVEIRDEAARSHPKAAIQVRNRSMVDPFDPWYAMSNMKPMVHFRRWLMREKAARL